MKLIALALVLLSQFSFASELDYIETKGEVGNKSNFWGSDKDEVGKLASSKHGLYVGVDQDGNECRVAQSPYVRNETLRLHKRVLFEFTVLIKDLYPIEFFKSLTETAEAQETFRRTFLKINNIETIRQFGVSYGAPYLVTNGNTVQIVKNSVGTITIYPNEPFAIESIHIKTLNSSFDGKKEVSCSNLKLSRKF